MLTIEIKANDKTIAKAALINISDLADTSDYRLHWVEAAGPVLGIEQAHGKATIKDHRRRQSVWALVAKATVAILDHMAGDPREIR